MQYACGIYFITEKGFIVGLDVGRHKSLVSKFTQKGFIIDWGTSGFKKYE
jgi:hypothetical protein